jgi:hypothetical protein
MDRFGPSLQNYPAEWPCPPSLSDHGACADFLHAGLAQEACADSVRIRRLLSGGVRLNEA